MSIKQEAAGDSSMSESGFDSELNIGAGGSPDSGPGSEGVKLDLKGKTDQAKIAELQKVGMFALSRIGAFMSSKIKINDYH